LDGNYVKSENEANTRPQQHSKDRFNQFPQRNYTAEEMAAHERALINKSIED
jgi:hypothetical protein